MLKTPASSVAESSAGVDAEDARVIRSSHQLVLMLKTPASSVAESSAGVDAEDARVIRSSHQLVLMLKTPASSVAESSAGVDAEDARVGPGPAACDTVPSSSRTSRSSHSTQLTHSSLISDVITDPPPCKHSEVSPQF